MGKFFVNRKKTGQFLMIFFAVMHLSVISLFIWTDIAYRYPESIGRWTSLYMNYAGSNRDYSFFAPSVANALRAVCVVNDSSGIVQVYKIGTPDRETNFRFDCLISACMRKQEGMDMFSQSWAAFYLSHHPHASSATIISQTYEIPPIKAYQRGEQSFWRTIYTGTFIPKSFEK